MIFNTVILNSLPMQLVLRTIMLYNLIANRCEIAVSTFIYTRVESGISSYNQDLDKKKTKLSCLI